MTHTAEVAHDTELLRLLGATVQADHALGMAVQRLRNAATFGFRDPRAHDTERDWVGYAGRYTDLPAGIIYHTDIRVGRTWQNVYLVKTNDGADKLANVADLFDIDVELAADRVHSDRPDRILAARIAYAVALRAHHDAHDAVATHERSYTGWDRYWLVTSSDGHVHRSRNCTTCYDTTRYALIPTLSGGTLDETVALVGPALCSVCYPLAPTDLVDGAKVTGKVAELLLTESEDAFRAKLVELAAKRAARCSGSGTTDHDRAGYDRYSRWAHCPICGDTVSVTATGKLRAHQPRKAS